MFLVFKKNHNNQLNEDEFGWGDIEKALSHKYIQKIPSNNSKRPWNYIYPKDLLHPLKCLMSIFGLSEKKIDDDYEKNNIKADFNCDKNTFAQHVLEYFRNKAKWNKFFSEKSNRDSTKTPVKENKKKPEDKSKPTGERKGAAKVMQNGFKANRSLMRKVWSIYNPVESTKADIADKVAEEGHSAEVQNAVKNAIAKVNTYKVGDIYGTNYVSGIYAGDGKIEVTHCKDGTYNVGDLIAVQDDFGYRGRKVGYVSPLNNAKDETPLNNILENLKKDAPNMSTDYLKKRIAEIEGNIKAIEGISDHPTMNKVGEKQIDENAKKEQLAQLEILTAELNKRETEAPKVETPTEETNEPEEVEKPGYTDAERSVIAVAYKKEHDFDPTLSDFAYYEKIKAKFPELAAKGDLLRTIANVKGLMLSPKQLDDAKNYIENRNKPVESEEEKTENRSEAMMGNQNAKKDGAAEETTPVNVPKADDVYKLYQDGYSWKIEVKGGNTYEVLHGGSNNPNRTIYVSNQAEGEKVLKNLKKNSLEALQQKGLTAESVTNNIDYDRLIADAENDKQAIIQKAKDMRTALDEFDKTELKPVEAIFDAASKKHSSIKEQIDELQAQYNRLRLPEKKTEISLKINSLKTQLDAAKRELDTARENWRKVFDESSKKGKEMRYVEDKDVEYENFVINFLQKAKEAKGIAVKDLTDQDKLKKVYDMLTATRTGEYNYVMSCNADDVKVGDKLYHVNPYDMTVQECIVKEVDSKGGAYGWERGVTFVNKVGNGQRYDKTFMSYDWLCSQMVHADGSLVGHIQDHSEHGITIPVLNNNQYQEHLNRSNAMLGNQNAKKDGISEESVNANPEAESYKAAHNLTQDEYEALDEYTQSPYVNSDLRNDSKLSDTEDSVIKGIDSVIAKNTVKENKLYRGVTIKSIFPDMNIAEFRYLRAALMNPGMNIPDETWVDTKKYTNLKENVTKYLNELSGKVVTDKGYMSTSKNFETASNFATEIYSNQDGVIIEFNVPDGTHGIDLDGFQGTKGTKREDEVLLGRNSNYKITGTKVENGKFVITADIIPESEAEKEKNRSDAMQGNDNAAGEHNVQQKTTSDMIEEEKQVEKAREDAGLPKIGINVGERVSAMDDSISLNPNAVNYAYKDTGYIAGSQKEKIQDFWKRKKESGEGTSVEEIDWNTLEENTRYAEQQITKENILGDVNYNEYKENGMNSRAGFLASKVFAAIGKAPVGHSVESRKNYVIAINTLKDRIKNCKTITDIDMVVEDIYNEATGYFSSQIERTPEVMEITKKIRTLQDAQREFSYQLSQYMSNDKEGGLIYTFNNDPKFSGDYNKLSSKQFYNKYADDIQKLVNKKADEIDPSKKHDVTIVARSIPGLGVYHDAECNFTDDAISVLRDERRAESKKQREALRLINKTAGVWKELGEKFTDLRYSKTYQLHRENLLIYNDDVRYYTDAKTGEKKESFHYKYRKQEYDKYQTWDWLDDKGKRAKREGSKIIEGKAKRKFEMIVPENLERIGGRNISVKSTEELKKAFNFRDIQTGSYVQQDPVSAKWHTDNIASGFADLCDVIGIRDDQVSLNGRLAMAIGARGHGTALAHYEPVERVINITKFKGGGSLGHEWFHSFDNMIAEAINGGNLSLYMTDTNAQSKNVRLVDAFKPNAYHDAIPDNETSNKVKAAFDNLVNAMMTGDTPETEIITYTANDVAVGKELFEGDASYYSYYGNNFRKDLKACKTLDEAIKVINERYKSSVDMIRANAHKMEKFGKYDQKRMKETVKNYNKYRAAAVAYFDNSADKSNGGEGTVLTGRIVSRFYEDAKKLDAGKDNPYWSTPIEMAARSFEAYLCDKLKVMGRKNDYLSGHANNEEYGGEFYPYPTERDRKKINDAFDKLWEVIRSENAIRKALAIIKNGRFLIRK